MEVHGRSDMTGVRKVIGWWDGGGLEDYSISHSPIPTLGLRTLGLLPGLDFGLVGWLV